jgi:hypothetical protein
MEYTNNPDGGMIFEIKSGFFISAPIFYINIDIDA